MILLSIITIVRNGERTIRRCVESVKKDFSEEIEYIVVDGSSSDKTVEIVREIMPEAVVVSEPDRGVYNAMNKGLAFARGKFVAFLKADDYYLPHVIPIILEKLQQYENDMDVIYGNIYANGSMFRPPAWLASFHHARIFHTSCFVRRSCYCLCDGFNTHYRICADLDFFLQAKEQCARFLYVNKTFTVFTSTNVSLERRNEVSQEIRRILLSHGFSYFFAESYYILAHIRAWIANCCERNRHAIESLSESYLD